MRPIDADALMNELMEVRWEYQMLDNTQRADIAMGGLRNAEKKVEEAPTVDAVPRWIPCEERLPKDGECVLAWAGGSVDVVRFEMGISQETREKMKKGEIPDPIEYVWCLADGYTPRKRSDSYCRSDEDGNNQKPYCWVHAPMEYFGQDVKAWMPLPEPYEGERKDDEDR